MAKTAYESPRIRWTCLLEVEDGAVPVDEELWHDETAKSFIRWGIAVKGLPVDLVRHPYPGYANTAKARLPRHIVRRAAKCMA